VEPLEERLAPATFVWTGAGDGLNWANAPNWSGGVAPTGANDDLVFPDSNASHNTTNNLVGSPSFRNITVAGHVGGPVYTFKGNEFTLTGSVIVNTGVLGTGGAPGADFQMPVRLGGTSADRRFVTVDTGASVKISGQLRSNLASPAELAKSGAGTLLLSADNINFKSRITVQPSGGTLVVQHLRALGDPTVGTVVGANASLQIDTAASTFTEPLTLNGFGATNAGALENIQGSNTWNAPISLDSNTYLGARAGTTLTIQGVISDTSSGHDLSKVGLGTLVFASPTGNTYRGLTSVNNGILRISHPLALGPSLGTPESGTVVNYNRTTQEGGTLQLTGGITVFNEQLTLNGPGTDTGGGLRIGAINNLSGTNEWAGGAAANVILGSQAPNGTYVQMGAEAGSTLLISSKVAQSAGISTISFNDPSPTSYSLLKIRPGQVVFSNNNSYTGNTRIMAGRLTIRDSGGLGTANLTTVLAGAALELEVDTGVDPYGRNLADDSVTGLDNDNRPQLGLRPGGVKGSPGAGGESIRLFGTGIGGTGALHSLSGINRWNGAVSLFTSDAGVGVDQQPVESNTALYFDNDYSLSIYGNIDGAYTTTFHKGGLGHLILPNNNTYLGPTNIDQGWVTVQAPHSLGDFVYGSDTIQAGTRVFPGAALHLKAQDPAVPFNLVENLILAGNGITHNYGLINQKGALENLSGNNTVGGPVNFGTAAFPDWRSSNIQLAGNAGIGVEALVSEVQTITRTATTGTFTLTFNGQTTGALDASLSTAGLATAIQNALNALPSIGGIGGSVSVAGAGNTFTVTFGTYLQAVNVPLLVASAGAPVTVAVTREGAGNDTSELTISAAISDFGNTAGGITKLGTKRLTLLGEGSYTGDVFIREGVLRAQQDTALGLASTGTTSGTQTYTQTTTYVGDPNSPIGVPGNNELQTIAIRGTPGTYRLKFNGSTTGPIASNATPAAVQAALNALPSVINAGGTVTVTQAGNVYAISFGGKFAGVNQSQLVADTSGSGVLVAINTLQEGDGPSLELKGSEPLDNGGQSAGLSISNERLVLNLPAPSTGAVPGAGLGNFSYGDSPLTVVSSDHLWHGPIVLNADAAVQVRPAARVIVDGAVSDNVTSNLILTGGAGSPEVQTFSGPATGTFTLTFNGDPTVPIAAGSDPALVQQRLNALLTIGGAGGFVTVTQPVAGGPYRVSFGGGLVGVNVPALVMTPAGGAPVTANTVVDGADSTGGKLILAAGGTLRGATLVHQGALLVMDPNALGGTGVNEMQTITVSGTGTFRLTFNGEQTGPLDITTLTPTALAAALNGLNSIKNAGGVVTAMVDATHTVFTVTFGGLLRGFNQPQLISNSANAVIGTLQQGTGGTVVDDGAAVDVQGNVTVADEPLLLAGLGDGGVADTQTLTVSGATTGSFTLTFNGVTTDPVLHPLLASSPTLASDIKAALLALPNIGFVGGSVTVTQNSNIYTVTIGGSLRGLDQPQLIPNTSGGTTVAVRTLAEGGAAVTPTWFRPGPAATNNGQTVAREAVAGRVNSVAVDPTDPNVMYIATAGGGSWKTINGGHTWEPLFDASPVNRLFLPGNTGQFTLTFNGQTTGVLNMGSATLAADIEAALNALPSIRDLSPVNGRVVVHQIALTTEDPQGLWPLNPLAPPPPPTPPDPTPPLAYDITFKDALSQTTPRVLVAQGVNGAVDPVVTTNNPTTVVGAIAVDPNDPRIVYIGTGDANSTEDSFYGTGVYKSIDSGKTWKLLANSDGTNPIMGLAVTKIVVDPGNPGVRHSDNMTQNDPYTLPQPGYRLDLNQPRRNAPTGTIYVATSNVRVNNAPGGSVIRVAVTDSGLNYYTTPPTVTFSAPQMANGVTATGEAILKDGKVVGIHITNPGSGYTGRPNVTISAPSPNTWTDQEPPSDPQHPDPQSRTATAVAEITGAPGVYRFDEGTTQVQTLTLPAIAGVGNPGNGTFTLTYNDLTGIGTQTTAQIRLDSKNIVADIQAALNNLDSIKAPKWPGFAATGPGTPFPFDPTANGFLNGLPAGSVTVYQSPINPLQFSIVMRGGLAQFSSPLPAQPAQAPFLPYLPYQQHPRPFEITAAGQNGAADPQVDQASTWVNLTKAVSTARATLNGQLAAPPNTPGPDDHFLITFPGNTATSTTAAWTDLTLTYIETSNPASDDVDLLDPDAFPNTFPLSTPAPSQTSVREMVPVLYASLGQFNGTLSNGVFRTENPNVAPESAVPTIWYTGDPGVIQSEMQTITVSPWASGGNYQLGFKNAFAPISPPFLPASTDALVGVGNRAPTIEAVLNSLPTIGGIGGTVSVILQSATPTQLVFKVTFGGALANSDQPAIQARFTNPPTVTIAEVVNGSGVDNRSGFSAFEGDFNTGIPRDGNIKITSFTSVRPNPYPDAFPHQHFAQQIDHPDNVYPVYTNVTVYAAVFYPEDDVNYPTNHGMLREIVRSPDGGKTWATIAAPPNPVGSQGWYDADILATDPNVLYVAGYDAAGTQHVFRYANATGAPTNISVGPNGKGPHTGIHALAVSAADATNTQSELIAATDSGVWRLDLATSNWSDINGDLANAQLNSVAGHPTSLDSAYASSRFNGLQVYQGGLAWQQTDDNDSGAVRVNPLNPQIVYHIENIYRAEPRTDPQGATLRRSTDGGQTWTTILNLPGHENLLPSRYPPLVIDSVDPNRLLVGGFWSNDPTNPFPGGIPNGIALQESLDGGNTWRSLDSSLRAFLGPIQRVYVTAVGISTYQGPFQPDDGFALVADRGSSSYDRDTIYVAEARTNGIYLSKDHGQTWVNRTPSGVAGFGGTIRDIVVDPSNRDVVYVTVTSPTGGAGKVFKSTNAGRTWVSANGSNYTVGFPNLDPTAAPPTLTASGTGLLGDNPSVTVTSNGGLQTISFANVRGGTFTLTHNGTTTAPIIWTSNNTILGNRIQAALDALHSGTVSSNAIVTITFPTAQPTIAANPLQYVDSITVDNGGSGFANPPPPPPVVTLYGGGPLVGTGTPPGQRATANGFAVGGVLAGITVTNHGSGYILTPNVVVTGGTGALAHANMAGGLTYCGVTPTIGVSGGGTTQTLTIGGPITGGTFSLSLDNNVTLRDVAWSPNPTVLAQNISNALAALGAAPSTVSARVDSVVNFNNPQPAMSVNVSGLTGTSPAATVITNSTTQQTVRFSGGITGGTFTLTLRGVTTTPIPWSQNPVYLSNAIQGAVNALFATQVTPPSGGVPSPEPRGGNLPDVTVWKLIVDPRYGDLYAGTDIGVYHSADGGNTWERFGAGMPNVQVRDLELNQTTNTLLAATYGRGMYQLFLDDAKPRAGALRAISGSGTWTGTVQLVGDATTHPVSVGANGSQAVLNGITAASLNIVGNIVDRLPSPGNDPELHKVGLGDVIFSADNSQGYGGLTIVDEGALVVRDAGALGRDSFDPAVTTFVPSTIVGSGAALHLESDLRKETVQLFGRGVQPPFNGHNTGSLRSVSGNNTFTGTLILGDGSVDIGVDSGSTLTIGGKTGLPATEVGTITDGTNAFGFAKESSGTLVLASANTYDGETEVIQGALRLRDNRALGPVGSSFTEVLAGAQLQLQTAPDGSPVAGNEEVYLAGTGINNTGAMRNIDGDNTWLGRILLWVTPGYSPPAFPTGAVSFGVDDDADTLTIAGPIDESGGPSGIAKVGPGKLRLTAANTYSGTTFVHEGVVQVRNNLALGGNTGNNEVQRVAVSDFIVDGVPGQGQFRLTFNGQTTAAIASNAPATGPGSVQTALEGLGNINPGDVTVTRTAVLSGLPGLPNTFYVYTITFTGRYAGKDVPLMLATGLSGSSAEASAVSDGQLGTLVDAGAALELDGNGANLTIPASESIGLNGTGVAGGGALRNVSGNNTWQGGLVLITDANVGVAAGTQLTASGVVQDYGVFDPLNPTAPALAPVPAGGLAKVGTGTLVFPGSNTYSGKTTVAEGVLNIQNAGSLGVSGPEVQELSVFGPGGTFALAFTHRDSTGQRVTATTAALDVLSPTLRKDIEDALNALSTIGGVGGSVSVAQGTGSNSNVYTITFGGSLLLDNQEQIVAIPTPGVLTPMRTIVDGPEGTVVNGGATLQLQNLAAPMTREALTLNGSGFNGAGALENLAGANTWDRLITLDSNSAIAADPGTTLVIDQPISDDDPVSGLTRAFGVTKLGTGTVEYAGATSNDYTGLTQINEGLLRLNKTGGAQAIIGDLSIGNVPTPLPVPPPPPPAADAFVRWQQPDQVADSATVTVNPDGVLDLNGLAETMARLRILDGLAMTGAGGAMAAGALDMTGGKLSLGAGGRLDLTGNVTAASSTVGEAVIEGPGVVALDGATRDFTVNDGPQATDLHLLGGAAITGAGGVNKLGAGRLELDGANTYTGTTTVVAGDLQVDGSVGDVSLQGGTLSGVGTVGPVTSTATGGTVAPGDNGTATTTGILTSGNIAWNPATNFRVQVNTPTPGTGHDQLQVNGTIDLNGANLLATFGPLVDLGQEFTIITATGGVTGQFVQGTRMFVASAKYTIVYNTNSVVIRPEKTDVSIDLHSNINPTVFGQKVTFTATLNAEAGAGTLPAGQRVNFRIDGGSVISADTDANGQAMLMLNSLPVGTHTVRAEYLGTSIFNPATADLTPNQTVNQASTTVTATVTPSNSVFSQGVTVTANVGVLPPGSILPNSVEPTGQLTFHIRNISTSTDLPDRVITLAVSDHGAASVFLDDLPVAVYSVRAEYAGDASFRSSVTFSDQQFIIDRSPSKVTVTSSSGSIGAGEAVDLTARVTASPTDNGGVATGKARFFDGPAGTGVLLGEVDLVGGAATLHTTRLTGAGAHTITVVYGGDTNFFPSTGTLDQLVRGDTTTTVTSLFSPSGLGQNVAFTAAVKPATSGATPPSSGKVKFFIDGVERSPAGGIDVNASGQATFNISSLTLGLHRVTAQFQGSPAYNPSPVSPALLHQVVAFTTTMTLSKTPSPTVVGQAVALTATVTSPGRVVTGSVRFFLDGVSFGAPVALVAGRASFAPRGIPAGDHVITAIYTGSAVFGAARVDVPHTVNKANTATSLVSSVRPSLQGQPVTFTAAVAAVAPGALVPPGQVMFVIDGVPQGPVTLNAQGRAAITRSDLSAGTHTVAVSYLGSANYNASDSLPLMQIVNPPPPASRLVAAVTPSTVVVGQPFAITVFAKDIFNNVTLTYNAPVSIRLIAAPPGGVISGVLDGTFAGGVATLPNLFVNVGGRYRVRIFSGSLVADFDILTIGRQT
jgi:autotransporter-associated beta strand protein